MLSSKQYAEYAQFVSWNRDTGEQNMTFQADQFDGDLTAEQAGITTICEKAAREISEATIAGSDRRKYAGRWAKEDLKRDTATIALFEAWLEVLPSGPGSLADTPIKDSGLAMLAPEKDQFRFSRREQELGWQNVETKTGFIETKRWAQEFTPRELVAEAKKLLQGVDVCDVLIPKNDMRRNAEFVAMQKSNPLSPTTQTDESAKTQTAKQAVVPSLA